MTKVILKNNEAREILEAALWRYVSSVTSERGEEAFADETWECCELVLGGKSTATAVAIVDERLARLNTLRSAIEMVRSAEAGETVNLSVAGSALSEQLRAIRRGIEELNKFWREPGLRERTITVYDVAGMLINEFDEPVGMGA